METVCSRCRKQGRIASISHYVLGDSVKSEDRCPMCGKLATITCWECTPSEISCNHSRLSFGSGAYFVICLDCNATWKPENEEEMKLRCMNNSLLFSDDVRVKL